MVWYGHSYVTAGITLDDVVIILSSRPRKPIPAGGRAHFTQLALMLAHTGSHVPSTLGIVILFKLKHLRDSNQGSVNICSAT
jgi:hypothetical protein